MTAFKPRAGKHASVVATAPRTTTIVEAYMYPVATKSKFRQVSPTELSTCCAPPVLNQHVVRNEKL